MLVATLPGEAWATSTTCATSAVCAEYVNTYASAPGGVAIHGEANGGIGVRGTSVKNTGFYGASGSGNFTAPGVEGESTNVTGSDAAAGFGLSLLQPKGNAPSYGIVSYGQIYGVIGDALKGSGDPSTPYSGVYAGDESGVSSYNAALIAKSGTQVGVLAESNGTPTDGVMGEEPIGVYAVADPNSNSRLSTSIAVEAESASFPVEAYNSKTEAIVDLASPGDLIYGCVGFAPPCAGEIVVDGSGNEFLSGSLTTNSAAFVRKAGRSGTTRLAYGAETAVPEIEDVGEATLTNGRAFVPLDAALADSIDMRRAYHVFVTPDGDCKGLYVAQRSSTGFLVRELGGGRSTLDFEYRVVAKPIGEDGARLALAPPIERRAPAGRHRAGRMPAPMSPEERLRLRLGPQGYARAIADLERRISGR
jgi:hypothetical protein